MIRRAGPVCSVGNLTADNFFFPNDSAGIQIHQLHDNGGRTIVYSKTVVVGGGIAGFHIGHDPVVFPMDKGYRNIKSGISAEGYSFRSTFRGKVICS